MLARTKLGARLRAVRNEKQLTQEQAAERAAIHPKHLGVLESGKANVTFGTLVALACAYEVSVSTFFEDSPARGSNGRPRGA